MQLCSSARPFVSVTFTDSRFVKNCMSFVFKHLEAERFHAKKSEFLPITRINPTPIAANSKNSL
jgi:hypothetical protein